MSKNNTDTQTEKPNAAAAKEPNSAPKEIDYLEQIGGSLTHAKATEVFGKANALSAMKAVAGAGGFGMLDDSELTSVLFGGLAIPVTDENNSATENAAIEATRSKIGAALNGLK